MARSYRDRVLVTTTTTGTGTLTQLAAVTGFQAPPAGDDAKTFVVCIYAVDASGNPTGDWEVTESVYTHSGTTWSRGTLMASSTGSRITFAAGTKYIAVVSDAAKAALPDVQIFTGNGTWTAPAGINFVAVSLMGGGGGGGSGRRGASLQDRTGGCGGGGGGRAVSVLPATVAGASQTITVGAAGAGGAAITVDDTHGNDGTAGGDTSFGSLVYAKGGGLGQGGTTGFPSAGTGGKGTFIGANGGASQVFGVGAGGDSGTTGASGAGGGAGGGGGGYVNSSDTIANGAIGGARAQDVGAGGAGAAGTTGAGQNGGNGGAVTANFPYGGGGGGGGAANKTAAAGTGGNGGDYGGGGAGGGASANGFNSGAGGNGGAGICVVVSW